MHNKKWSKKLKTTLSITMISIMLLPSTSLAVQNRNLKYIKDNTNNASFEIKTSQIKEGVDIKTDKLISVIVEFKEMPTEYSSKKAGINKFKANSIVDNDHKKFESFLNKLKKDKKTTYSSRNNIKHSYKNTFNGVALSIKGTDVEKLLECSAVKNIWEDKQVQLELPKEKETKLNEEITPYMDNSKTHLGIEKLQKEGINGKGIKVGVLDTGIDYNHPDLKDNYKGGYDFVDKDNDPMEATLEDWKKSNSPEYSINGSPYYTSHGTHVSGTIAANGANKESEFVTTGIAPEADLYSYRVLGPYGSGYTADILAAIEKSVEDGMDVINLSLGANVNNPLYPTSVACNNAMLAGVTTVVANGNAGPNAGTVGSPATSPLAISVGASSVDTKIQTFDIECFGIKENSKLLARDFDTKLENITGESELVDCGLGKSTDFDGKNLTDKVALIERGEITFNDKIMNAKKAGAKGIIIYNNVDGEINVNLGLNNEFITTIGMTKENGNILKEELKKNQGSKINISMGTVKVVEGDELADFSSRGPVIDGNIKPDIVAPGVSILSTYPEFMNDKEDGENYSKAYSRLSGTSMASPHVAGVAALIKQQNKDYDPFDVKVALMNTSDDLRHQYTVNEVGAGRIDPNQAVKSGISIRVDEEDMTINDEWQKETIKHETASLSFGNIIAGDKDVKIEKELLLNNITGKTNTFDVSVEYLNPTDTNKLKDAKKNKVKLNIKQNAVANKKTETKIKTTLTIPKNAEFGMYQGYINLESRQNKSEKYQVPFSVKYTEFGIENVKLASEAISVDLEWMHAYEQPGMNMILALETPAEKIHVSIRDYDTKKPVGYVGWINGAYITPNVDIFIPWVIRPDGLMYPIKDDGRLNYNRKPIAEGKYILELRATDKEGREDIVQKPFIVDHNPAKNTVDKESGVYEISEEDFTIEKDKNGVEHNAFWIHGNVQDEGIGMLKSMGIDASNTDLRVKSMINGVSGGPSFKVDKDGNYKFGITLEDVAMGPLSFTTCALDKASSFNMHDTPHYTFIKKGEPYVYTKLKEVGEGKSLKKEIREGESLNATLSFNNIEKTNKFKADLRWWFESFKLEEIKLTDEAEKLLNSKGYHANITYDTTNNIYEKATIQNIQVEILDENNNKVEIEGDIDLVDIKLKLENDREFDMSGINFFCKNQAIYDKDGKQGKIFNEMPIFSNIKIPQNSSMLVLGEQNEAIRYVEGKGGSENFIWIEGPNGEKYKVDYRQLRYSYTSEDLPVSDKTYKVISNAPGHFKTEYEFTPSRNIDGELVGKNLLISKRLYALAGDVDGNGAIDIHDAISLAKDYGKGVSDATKSKDFNLDKMIDKNDMKFIVKNFMQQNLRDENSQKPEETSDAKTLQDVLNEIGYN